MREPSEKMFEEGEMGMPDQANTSAAINDGKIKAQLENGKRTAMKEIGNKDASVFSKEIAEFFLSQCSEWMAIFLKIIEKKAIDPKVIKFIFNAGGFVSLMCAADIMTEREHGFSFLGQKVDTIGVTGGFLVASLAAYLDGKRINLRSDKDLREVYSQE